MIPRGLSNLLEENAVWILKSTRLYSSSVGVEGRPGLGEACLEMPPSRAEVERPKESPDLFGARANVTSNY